MRTREEIVLDLIKFEGNIFDLEKELSAYPWDCENPIMIVTKEDIISILIKFKDNKISYKDVFEWADAIENRDDIDFEPVELEKIIFQLAYPDNDVLRYQKMIHDIYNKLIK